MVSPTDTLSPPLYISRLDQIVVIHVDGGQRLSKYSVAGSQIVDLKIMPQDAAARQINGQASWSGPTNGNGTTAAGDSITDPAIISVVFLYLISELM